MAPVRDCDYDRVQAVGYGNVVSLFPCVIAPFALAVLSLAFAWRLLWKDWKETDACICILFGAELLVETIFGALCWGFCLWFMGEGQYMGGESMCAFQGWFVGFYFFAQPTMLSLLSVGSYSLTSGGASTVFTPKVLVMLCCSVAFLAALLAGLPLFGLSHYAMPTNYCTFDLQDTPFALLWLMTFALLCCCLLYGPIRLAFAAVVDKSSRSSKLTISSGIVALHSVGAWMVPMLIAIHGLASGSSCETNRLKWRLFGLAAFSAHWQQLANPLLLSVWWRRELTATMTKTEMEKVPQ